MKESIKAVRYVLLVLLILLLFIIGSIPGLIPRLAMGTPILVIPVVCAAALYEKETAGAFLGLFAGALLDCYSADGGIYSTVVLFVCCGICGFLGRFIMSENFLAGVTLTSSTLFIYLVGKWLIFRVILFEGTDWQYLLNFSLPTFVYTLVMLMPLFPIVRWINRRFG